MERTAYLAPASQIMVGSAVVMFLASAGLAQVIHPDQMLGTFSPQLESASENTATGGESAGSEPDKAFDHQMLAPDLDASGVVDMNMLRTPDSTDADEARESDRQSSVSY